jgi:hypothetical protein
MRPYRHCQYAVHHFFFFFYGSASLIHATLKGTLSSKTWRLPRRTRPVPRSTISTVHPSAHDTQNLAPWSSIALPDLLNHSSDIRERKRTVHWQDLPFHLPQKVPGLRPSRMNIVNLHALLSHCGWAHGGHTTLEGTSLATRSQPGSATIKGNTRPSHFPLEVTSLADSSNASFFLRQPQAMLEPKW